ncbi:aminotransferase class I/II-fold pyridoxal phosphate-dependent enzyme [Enterobacter ludwigii]|uniref:pyridoxal phosphate-dependent aminotransferase n=1 Tax=Enterobacter ludwigii TaxID=299767 RepID=UPI002B4BFDAC|nr:aminotransferase class I/II-fold pyridoxal phosphate-dependent enzyme [Enterobacter ludwigii]WRM04106.1 aminotransferase class I/II-fold pyridoxal phosphate-dependent enzyme [Enterobacter ludwigii]
MRPVSAMARKIVQQLSPYRPFIHNDRSEHMIVLTNNENLYGGEFSTYPDTGKSGLEAFAASYLNLLTCIEGFHDTGHPALTPENIILTSGSAVALEQIFKAYFEPGKDVVTLTPPFFGIFSRLAQIYNIQINSVPLSGPEYNRLDVNAICNSGTKGVILCDPNNPTGNRICPGDIAALLERYQGLVVIDEAYVEYSHHSSALKHLSSHPNVLVLRTFSKAMGMAGLRIGAVIGDSSFIEPLRRVQLPFALSSIAVERARHLIEQPDTIIAGIRRFQHERDRLYSILKTVPAIEAVWGNDAGFLTIQVKHIERFSDAFHRYHIHAVFNPEGMENYIRISPGTPGQNDYLVQAISSASDY